MTSTGGPGRFAPVAGLEGAVEWGAGPTTCGKERRGRAEAALPAPGLDLEWKPRLRAGEWSPVAVLHWGQGQRS